MNPKLLTGTAAEVVSKANKLLQNPDRLGYKIADFSSSGDQVVLLLEDSDRPNHAPGSLLELAIIDDAPAKAEKHLADLQSEHPGWKPLRVAIKPVFAVLESAKTEEGKADAPDAAKAEAGADGGAKPEKAKKIKPIKPNVLLLAGLFQP